MPSIALKALTEADGRPPERERRAERQRGENQAVRRAEGDELVDDTTILLIHFRE